nr:phage holin family protein [uncultured Campylobacter sp.]
MNFPGKEYLYLFWVLVVGAIGGILGLLDENGNPRNRRTLRALLAGVLTAMFLCWITFVVANHFIHDIEFSLAIGGVIAFMGGDWVRRKIDKAANKKIDGLGDGGYGRGYDDYGGSFRHENFDDERMENGKF